MSVKPLLLTALLCWTVTAQPTRVVDGDTFIANVEVWMASAGSLIASERIRVLGVDTPERGRPRHSEATAFTDRWLRADGAAFQPVTLAACRRDSFGRVLADVTRGVDNLATLLRARGLGKGVTP